MEARAFSILAVRCVDCGDAQRLGTVTNDSVISRCYVCGDVAVRERYPESRSNAPGGTGGYGSLISSSGRSAHEASRAAPGPSL